VPNASDYRDAAQRFGAIAEHLLREAGAIAGWRSGFVSDGLFRDTIDASNERTRDHLRSAGADMGRLARVCEVRADVCAQYAGAVRRYLALSWDERLLVRPPTPPAAWVDV